MEYDSALQAFNEAYTRSALLQSKHPDDGARLYNRGQAEFWVGYVHWMQGDFDGSGDVQFDDFALLSRNFGPLLTLILKSSRY